MTNDELIKWAEGRIQSIKESLLRSKDDSSMSRDLKNQRAGSLMAFEEVIQILGGDKTWTTQD